MININKYIRRLFAILLWVTASPPAIAAVVNVSAEFRPSQGNGSLEFTDLTPESGNCTNPAHRPACDAAGMKGINVSGIVGQKRIWTSNERHRWYLNLPRDRRVTVRSADGREFPVDFSILGGGYRLTVGNGEGETLASPDQRPLIGCTHVVFGDGIGSNRATLFYLARRSIEGQPCRNGGIRNSHTANINNFEIAYSMSASAATNLPNGIYTGSTTYTIGGEGSDFDLGNLISLSDNSLTVNFSFTVQHDYKVTYPSNSPRVILTPAAGWQQWSDFGTPPRSIQQELPFMLTTSSELSLKMRCEHDSNGRCGIQEENSETVVPIDVDVTIPGMTELLSGAPAYRHTLVAEQSGKTPPRFVPERYLSNIQSRLRFVADGTALSEMLQRPGSKWQGDVTLIFDTNP